MSAYVGSWKNLKDLKSMYWEAPYTLTLRANADAGHRMDV